MVSGDGSPTGEKKGTPAITVPQIREGISLILHRLCGCATPARIIRERMSLRDADQITPYDLINARTISAVIKTFVWPS